MSNELAEIYKNEVTEEALNLLANKYPSNLVVDMTNDDNFKSARKTRTERNKLVESINRRRIDTTNDIKVIGDSLVERVDEIYSVLVTPFEVEDARRKEIARLAEEAKKKVIDAGREKIQGWRNLVSQGQNSDSANVSSLIDAVTNIDCGDFHKDLVHDAMQMRETVLAELTTMLSTKLQFEESERSRLSLEAELAEAKAELAERAPEPVAEAPVTPIAAKSKPEVKAPSGDNQAERAITIKLVCTSQEARYLEDQINILLDSQDYSAEINICMSNQTQAA